MEKKAKKFKGKLAVGFFLDGQSLQVACLARQGKKVKLLDAQIVPLVEAPQSVPVAEAEFAEDFQSPDGMGEPLDLSQELKELDIDLEMHQDQSHNPESANVVYELLSQYGKRFMFGISIAEPEVYYAHFATNWMLKGKKLKQKIYQELLLEKPDIPSDVVDQLQVFPLAEGGVLAVVPEQEFQALGLVEMAFRNARRRAPRIKYVEPAEFSLLRLIRQNYRFESNEITAVIHVGMEFSRILFLQGNQLLHIAPVIAEGLDSYNIDHTVYSRLLLALDNQNIPRVDSIILTGEAYEAGIKPFLRQKFPPDVDIDYVRFNHLEINGLDPLMARFALPIGNALRLLDPTIEPSYNIDVTPRQFRERQKLFKLGLAGWVLLLVLPLSTYYTTMTIQRHLGRLHELEAQLRTKKSELSKLNGPRKKLQQLQKQLNGYDQVMNVLDAMLAGTQRWSRFLSQMSLATSRVGKIWVVDVKGGEKDNLILHGYSLYRSKIPPFANRFENSVLRKVEVQDIRGKTVYYFELEIPVPGKPEGEQAQQG
ncbi:MAG: hypothetical protein D6715_01265 [Calditrichaeota bacterium]|nr:MAG: hypothetical protein D6715_01265 [Calditrichota bacterium]